MQYCDQINRAVVVIRSLLIASTQKIVTEQILHLDFGSVHKHLASLEGMFLYTRTNTHTGWTQNILIKAVPQTIEIVSKDFSS